MKTEPETWTIKELLQDHDQAILKPNPEYQRGAVWRLPQQQMLIDSLLRGFHLPIFYFHRIDETTRHGSNTRFEILDGQQRVNAIARFRRGGFALLDPQAPKSRFPRHLRSTNCRWAQLSYDRLEPELQERFLDSPLSIAVISEADTNEARDLFVRLQSGSDLKPQERRDALPGEIGAAVAELAGRLDVAGGHRLFTDLMGLKPHTDRGGTRQFVAQLLLVLDSYRSTCTVLTDINNQALDRLYYDHMELGSHLTETRERLETILDALYEQLVLWSGPKLQRHIVIHLVLMAHQVQSKFTNSWKDDLDKAVSAFVTENLASERTFKQEGKSTEFYSQYSAFTRSAAAKADTIRRRHSYFISWMRNHLKLVEKDPQRSFSALDREYLYLLQDGRCGYAKDAEVCGDDSRMDFSDGHVHHVLPHSLGGKTELSNAVLIHKACNQKIGARHIPVPG